MHKNTFLLLLICLLLLGCQEQDIPARAIKPVATLKLVDEEITASIQISGIIQPAATTPLNFEVTGVVQTVNYDIGDVFSEGDVLTQLNPRDFELVVMERTSQLSEVNARLTELKNDFERQAQLLDRGLISKSVYDLAEAQFEAVKDQVDIAQTRLSMAQEDLSDTILKAPYSGTIASRNIEPSQRINPNQSVFVISGEGQMEVRGLVSESKVSLIQRDTPVQIKIPALNRMMTGQITEVASSAIEANAYPVLIALDANANDVRPGMSAEVMITQNKDLSESGHDSEQGGPRFVIPVSALLAGNNNQHHVYKINGRSDVKDNSNNNDVMVATHVLKKLQVTLHDLANQNATISGALQANDQLVATGVEFLSDGQQVTLLDGRTQQFNP